MNRRELLKWFGAGAVAVPVVAGMPKQEAAALIVAPPTIEVPPAPKIYSPAEAYRALTEAFHQRAGEPLEISVYIRRKDRPYSLRFNCDGYMGKFSLSQRRDYVNVTRWEDKYRRFLPVEADIELRLSGVPELVEGGQA
jgi:hypothetical protein